MLKSYCSKDDSHFIRLQGRLILLAMHPVHIKDEYTVTARGRKGIVEP